MSHSNCCHSSHHEGDHCCCHGEHGHECCHIHPHSEDHKEFAHHLIEMADQAWMDLLKEKIKEQIKISSGDHLDQLAKLVSQANHERWKQKMTHQKDIRDFKEKLCAFFQK